MPRERGARDDAKVGRIQRDIERTYNLPKNSVQIVNPDRTNTRDDKLVRNVRTDYSKKGR